MISVSSHVLPTGQRLPGYGPGKPGERAHAPSGENVHKPWTATGGQLGGGGEEGGGGGGAGGGDGEGGSGGAEGGGGEDGGDGGDGGRGASFGG